MKELIKQTLKLKNIPKIVETYFDNVETNIPLDIMVKGALSAKKIDMEKMKSSTIPGESEKIAKIDYWIYNREETTVIVQDMFGDYLLGQ
jgi:anionic cell wall polymer biosynthesis LytR-Cps2A-Psr (LCP) family protein